MIKTQKINNFTWDANGLWKTTYVKDVPKKVHISPYIAVTARYKDAKTGDETLLIVDAKGQQVRESAQILTPLNMPALIRKGFTIPTKNIHDISYALQLMRDTLTPITIYEEIGALMTPDHQNVIILDRTYVQTNFTGMKPLTSNPLEVHPQGSFKAWMEMFDQEVIGNVNLELAAAIGISGLVNSFLNKIMISELKSLMFHFVGDSSSGKTTAAMLALSTAGSPKTDDHTLYLNWNGTMNSIINSLADNHGIPILLDELSMSTTKSLTSALYSITDGRDKGRLNQDGTPKKVRTWNTSVISTGERSLLNNSTTSKNAGLSVRIIEFSQSWTSSSPNADNIKKAVKRNYGHILPLVARLLLAASYKDIDKKYTSYKNWFTNAVKKNTNSTDIRMIDYYTVITLSVDILGVVLDRDLQIDQVKQLLVNYHQNTVAQRSMADKGLESIIQFTLKNLSTFSTGSTFYRNFENNGFLNIDDSRNFIRLDILKATLDKLLKDDGYEDTRIIINALDKADLLADKDKDRKTVRKQCTDESGSKQRVPFYSIKLDINLKEILGFKEESTTDEDQHSSKYSDDDFDPAKFFEGF